jgi:general secretion pathway protein D
VFVVALVACGGGSSAFKKGREAEIRKDWDTALVNYDKAVQDDPENSLYLLHQRQARTQASFFHLKRGRQLLAENRRDEAAGEFHKAVAIDSTNEAAAQELGRLMAAEAEAKKDREKQIKEGMKPPVAPPSSAVVRLKPLPPEPVAHVRISGDSKKVYETLGKLGDLNVAFTAEFQPKSITLDLVNVKLEDALRILALETRTFWKPVTDNTILVVPENAANHRDFDDQVVKTIFLSNPLAAADRTQITTALKQLLNLQRIVDNPEANAIIVSDTPAKVKAAEELVHSLDRGKAEVLIDVAVMEADRDRVRTLGVSPGSTVNLLFTPRPEVQGNPGSGGSSSGGTTGTEGTIALNALGRISTADFSLILPSAQATALLGDAKTRVLQNPQVRTTDGQKASLKIGQRIPFASGSFLPSFAGGTGSGNQFGLLASTSFQYQDVGVQLEITPRVLANGEVSLHAKLSITSQAGSVNIGGIDEPVFGQREIEHDIRLQEGEVSLLGGLLSSQITNSVGGLPFLADIPGVRYLFSTEKHERQDNEILVMLTPHVVRLPERTVESAPEIAIGSGAEPTAGAGPVSIPFPGAFPGRPEPPQQ